MCRHLAYLGPPVALRSLLFDASHSLCHQARAPRHQEPGDRNPDGWGVGWYEATDTAPRLYRTTSPMWADPGLADDLGSGEATAVLAAARLASPGLPIEVASNAPFVDGPHLFSLNGTVTGFTGGVGDALRGQLSDGRAAAIRSRSDSEVLFALALDQLDAGATLGQALHTVVRQVLDRTLGNLNLLITDGRALAATVHGHTLFTAVDPDHALVASEPLDDGRPWVQVPEGSLLEVEPGPLDPPTISPL